jgi:hypothetical protein
MMFEGAFPSREATGNAPIAANQLGSCGVAEKGAQSIEIASPRAKTHTPQKAEVANRHCP